ASFVFYSWLSWFFGIVLFLMSVAGYVAPFLMVHATTARLRTFWFVAAIMAVLLPLFIFKYLNFVVGSIEQGLAALGVTVVMLHIATQLPPGISFHSFQLLAYLADVFKKRAPVEHRPGIFFLFSSFFPQLVAGPIERANHLMPQLARAGLVA